MTGATIFNVDKRLYKADQELYFVFEQIVAKKASAIEKIKHRLIVSTTDEQFLLYELEGAINSWRNKAAE